MKQRLEYIDALRGLAILLVVFMHVPQYGFGESVGGFYMECASMLAVPLFFFISGFVTDGKIAPPELKTYGKKVRVILIPTIVIGLFYAALNHIELGSLVTDKFKAGYWFTITLFEYYLIHDFVRLLSFQRQRVYDGLMVAAALSCYAVALPSVQRLYQDSVFLQVLGVSQWKYFIFFVLGMWARRFYHILQTELFGKGILLTFLLIYGGNEIWKVELSGFWFNVNLLLKEASIVLLAYTLFFKFQRVFSGNTCLGRMMLLLGTNTLEIYLLHYFVLPCHLDAFLNVEALVVNPMVAMYADLLVSLMVIGVVLATVYILREINNNPLRHSRAKGDGA